MVMSTEVIRNVVGIIDPAMLILIFYRPGNVISLGLFLSPCPTFCRIIKHKSVEEFKPDPYLATGLNCTFWVTYGLPFVDPDATLVATINGVGLGLELIYICIFFIFGGHKHRKKVVIGLIAEIIFAATVITSVLLVWHDHKRRSLAIGIVADVLNVIMYASPLTVMKKVVKTKSVKYMPFYLSLGNFLNGCIWTAFALIKLDIFLLLSNGIGAIFGAAQLVLYGCYFKSTSREEEATEKTSVQLQLYTIGDEATRANV